MSQRCASVLRMNSKTMRPHRGRTPEDALRKHFVSILFGVRRLCRRCTVHPENTPTDELLGCNSFLD